MAEKTTISSPQDYQKDATRTAPTKLDTPLNNFEIMLLWYSIGLAGETGEAVEIIKKFVFHRQPLDKEKLKKRAWRYLVVSYLSSFGDWRKFGRGNGL